MDYETKKEIGFQYVTDMMSPLSGPGNRMLRELSLFPFDNADALENEYEYISFFLSAAESYPTDYTKAKTILMRLKDIAGSIRAISQRELDETEMFELKSFCFLCEDMRRVFSARLPKTVTINGESRQTDFLMLDCLKEASDVFGGGEGFCIEDSASPALCEIRRRKRALVADIKKAKGEKRKSLECELADLSRSEYEIRRNILDELTVRLTPYKEKMLRNLEILGRMDLLIQKAELAKKYKLCRPVFAPVLQIAKGTNPMIAASVEKNGGRFCPISIYINRGVTVITGANMGGKTVALKTVALNTMLAQCGFFVFAESFSFPRFAKIEAAMLDGQDHERGLSSFAADVIRLNALYNESNGFPRLILCDEFASGTNAEEGSAIFRAFIDAFMKKEDFVVMTTHFDGVARSATARFQVKGLSALDISAAENVKEGIKTVTRFMDYGLLPVPKDAPMPRDAVKVCRLLGVNKNILDAIEGENQ